MKTYIQEKLRELEEELHIKILYAVESGSRAWGFASKDSDWDVRFIYIHQPEWYLSIDDKKAHIERMLPHDLDLSGWELRKTLKLFRKSNPPLLEWLRSPLLYLEQFSTVQKMKVLSQEYFNPKSCTYHYLHMAKGNFREYLKADTVRVKKYFYVLRPLLACLWIEKYNTMAPMEFDKMLNDLISERNLKNEIEKLLERKRVGDELDLEPRNDILNIFIENKITHFQEKVAEYNINTRPDTEKLNILFRETLEEVWGKYF